jgi:hypothetical protein
MHFLLVLAKGVEEVLEFPYQIQSFKSMDMQVCVGAKIETK